MEFLMNLLKKNNVGHVSIEVVVIGGLIIGFGAMTIGSFQDISVTQVNNSNSTIIDKVSSSELDKIWNS